MKKNRLEQSKKETSANNDSTVQKGLMKIYSNQDGSLPDISQLDARRQGHWKIILFSLVGVSLILAAIAWLGFIIFNPDGSFSTQSIRLELKGQQSIASGDEVIYVLEYKNVEKVPLHNVEIIFRYPDGFEFITATPAPNNNFNSSWQIGDLAKNQSGKIEIKGKLIGEVGSIKTINATASFQPENFSSAFKETGSFSSQITSSILEIELTGPIQILPEKKATYKISYRNNSEQDLTNIKILVEYPTNFIFQESTPKPLSEEADARNLNNQWLIENLGKKQEGEIEISGGYTVEPNLNQVNFKVQVGFFDQVTDEFSLQQEKTVTTEIIQPNLSLNLIINGSTQNQPINFDQVLTYSLVYKNLGQKDLDEIRLSVSLNSDILDWETLEDKNGGIIEGNKINWSKDQISELDLVRPLAEGTIDFSIRVKKSSEVNLDRDNLQVVSQAEATLEKIGELVVEDLKITSNEISNNINTDVQLKVDGRYFDDDNLAVGTGPLPPVVGQKTTFRLYWSIANSLHDITNVQVTANLPQGVDWENKFLVKVGEIEYSSKNRQVSWTIDRITANKGFDEVNLWFDVSVIPTQQQVRKLLILTDQANLTATDKETGSLVTKTAKAITSNLEDDSIGGGRGLVIDITE